MKTLLVCSLVLGAGLLSAAEVVHLGNTEFNGYPVIVPSVRSLKSSPGSFVLPRELSVSAPEEVDLSAFRRVYADEVEGGSVTAATGGSAAVRLELAERGVPQNDEGYRLTVGAGGITIRARKGVGLFYGLQTLVWMVRNRTGAALRLCTIEDWPDMTVRGVMLKCENGFDSTQMPRMREVLEQLASIKCNCVLCDLSGNLPFSIADEFSFARRVTRADIDAFVETARRNHVTLIPSLQCVSHARWLTHHRDWDRLKEGNPTRNSWCCSYCPQNAQAQRIVETVVDETCDMFKPKYFNLNLDELTLCPYGVCPKCRGADVAQAVVNHVRPLLEILRRRGIRPIVAHDEFVVRDILRKDSPFAGCLGKFGRDTMLVTWLYEHSPAELHFRQMKDTGRDMLFMSFMRYLPNVTSYPKMAHENGLPGGILSYWGMINPTFDCLGSQTPSDQRCPAAALAGTLLHASHCWNTDSPDAARIPYDGVDMFVRTFANRERIRFAAPASPLPIAGGCNALVGGDSHRRFPEFDAATIRELAAKAKSDEGRFRLQASKSGERLLAMVVAGSDEDAALPGEVRLPVGANAEGFSFLWTAAPNDDWRVATGQPIGRMELVYADGEREVRPIVRGRDVAAWNEYTGSALGRIVLRTRDRKGALVNLSCSPWRNPRPDVKVREIVIASEKQCGDALMVLAVSAYGLSAPVAATAPVAAASELADARVRFATVHDFAEMGLDGVSIRHAAPVGGDCGELTKEVVRIPGCGTVLKVVVPPPQAAVNTRVVMDVMLPAIIKAGEGTYTAEVCVDRPETITRADSYLIGEGPKCRRMFDFDRRLGLLANHWHRVQLPVWAYRGNEAGGVQAEDIRSFRLSFFLSNSKPVTFYFGKVMHTESTLPGRFDLIVPLESLRRNGF